MRLNRPAWPGEVWIGLVEVRPRPGNVVLGQALGAFTNVLAWASDASDYEARVRGALAANDFDVLAVSEAEPLRERDRRTGVVQALVDLARQVTEDDAVQFDTFQSYRSTG